MNDRSGRTSSLAITEKQPLSHRPGGGCVGSFFQLFDWNRKFAKKRLFSKKLLPPASAKQASKKFGGDAKQAKFRLIADENTGGFPNVKKHGTLLVNCKRNYGLQAPGLVVRLMGLESMPTVQQDKLNKAASYEIGVDKSEEFVGDHHGFCTQDQNLEKGPIKHEIRPQKLQKTGPFERLPVTRFGAEALQFKNVLSRSRKNHPKLASPVKSPKSLSSRNASRLIGAATEVLEPGLQVRNRAKYALTYSDTMTAQDSTCYLSEAKLSKGLSSCKDCGNLLDNVDARPKLEEHQSVFGSSILDYVNSSCQGSERSSERLPTSFPVREKEQVFWKGQEHFTSFAAQGEAKLSKGQSSCKDCGNLLDNVVARPKLEEHQSVFGSYFLASVNSSCQGSERSSERSPMSFVEQEKELVFRKGQGHFTSFAAQAMDNMQLHVEPISDTMPIARRGQRKWSLTSQECKPQKDLPPSIYLKHKPQKQKIGSVGRNIVPPRSKFSILQRNIVASAANAINEAKDFLSSNRSLSGRTRSRMPNKVDIVKVETESKFGNRQDDSLGPVRKRRSMNVAKQGEDSIKSRLGHLRERNRTVDSDSVVVSTTFSSPMKQKSGVSAGMEKGRDQAYSTHNDTQQKNANVDGDEGKAHIQKQFPLKGDTLGVVLAQKLKELTSQEEDELAYECTAPKRTAAMILQELISALNNERPYPQDDVAVRSREKYSDERGHVSTTNRNTTFKANANIGGASIKCSHDNDNLSPGSVLEASFSIDSSFSDNLDDDSGHKLHSDSTDCSCGTPQPLEPNTSVIRKQFVTDLHNHISKVQCCIKLTGSSLKGIKLIHAKEAIMNAELLIKNKVLGNLDVTHDFSVTRFLIHDFEALASARQAEISCFLGFEDAIDGNQFMGFIFDSFVEYLESRYSQYSKYGFKAWTRMLPVCMNSEMMISEVVEEIRRWGSFGGLVIDEVIEREMSCCLGKWTDFEIEEFEAGAEIDGEILQILLDEVVMDLLE
ncbi:hypothetical protein LguiA_014122 [Lonicera macranthoides]